MLYYLHYKSDYITYILYIHYVLNAGNHFRCTPGLESLNINLKLLPGTEDLPFSSPPLSSYMHECHSFCLVRVFLNDITTIMTVRRP